MFVALYTLAGSTSIVRDRRVLDELLRLVDAAGPVRRHRHAGDDREPVRLGRRRHSADAVRHDHRHRLPAGDGAAAVGVRHAGRGRRRSATASPQALVLAATVAGAVLVLRQVRTRSKLLLVGFTAAAVGFFTTLGVGTLDGRPLAVAADRTASPSRCGRSSPAR